ncbi:MAG TPA: hypothetical protein VK616_10715, partial [Flavitalea sp.]|nr:hypothetical protein [Flavitalea sp.]
MAYKKMRWLTLAGALGFCSGVMAQSPDDTLIQLKDAIEIAGQRYHLLQAHKYEVEAATKSIEVAKYSR